MDTIAFGAAVAAIRVGLVRVAWVLVGSRGGTAGVRRRRFRSDDGRGPPQQGQGQQSAPTKLHGVQVG